MPNLDNQTLLLAAVIVIGAAVVLQTLILLGMFLAVRKALRQVNEQVEDVRSAIMPIVYNTRELFLRLAPKVEGAVDNLSEIAEGLKHQAAEAQLSLNEILVRVDQQSRRVDSMITGALNGVDRAGHFVGHVVSGPVRQISAILASARAVIDTLRSPMQPSRTRDRRDDDMFV